MATIGKIRQRSGLVIALIGLAMLGFVATDLLNNKLFQGDTGPEGIARIYDEDMDPREFQQRYEKAISYRRANMGPDETLTASDEYRINEQVWNEYVNDLILTREYNTLGLTVTPEEIIELSAGANPHPIAQQYLADSSGRVNQSQILEFIRTVNTRGPEAVQFWADFAQMLEKQRLQEKYLNLISKAVVATDLEAKEEFIAKNKQANVQYVPLFTSSIADSTVSINDDEIRKYYEAHKEDYKKQESRSFEYVLFDVQATAQDTQAAEKWIEQQLPAFRKTANDSSFVVNIGRGEFTNTFQPKGSFPASIEDQIFSADSGAIIGPVFEDGKYMVAKVLGKKQDSVYTMRASHILVSPAGATEADTTEAWKKAREILAEVKQPGADFATIARTKSQDPGSAVKGGDLGWFREGAMVKPFNDAVKRANKGDIVTVQSQFGVHIIKVTEEKTKDLRKVAVLERSVKAGGETIEAAYNKAENIYTASTTDKKFDDVVAQQKLTKRVADNVKPNDFTIAGLQNPRELIRWSFQPERKVGDVSEPKRVGDKYVVAQLSRINKEGYAEFEEIKDQVKVFAIQEKKKEMLAEKLQQAMEKSQKLEDIAAAVQSNVSPADNVRFSNSYVPNLGNEPRLTGAIFGAPKDKVTGPVKGENGVFVIKVTSIADVQVPETFKTEREQLTTQAQGGATSQALEALRKQADVKDFRYRYY